MPTDADSVSLPAIATPPARNPSAKSNRPSSKQFSRGSSASPAASVNSSDELLPESDTMQSETVLSGGDSLSVLQQEKMQIFAESPDLELLCRENGLSASQFARNCESVTALDLFLGFWTSMRSVMYFPALKELSIINQPTICELEGVDKCPNLEKLCVTECGLTKITNLGGCMRLRQLNLSSNKIRKLENLDTLVNLETLWVNQNLLERLDGLWRLTNLNQLWACRNQIDRIDTALNCCENLMELNLADNRLSSFKGLLSLTNLDKLAVLILNDPHFGDNPVCRLCNYQTYLMCQLPRLGFLDTLELSTRNKQIAEATMIKKKMYYNMRIKAIKRDVHSRIRHAETIRNQAEHHMETCVAALVRHKKEIERFLIENNSRKNDAVLQEMLEKKHECINSYLRDRYCAVYRMNQDFERLRTGLRCTSETNIARLMLELETGGNIRLEDGKPSDAWFGSCVELVRSRLFLPDLQKFGVNDIQINRVTRINNRFLRNRFQARMEEVLVAPDKKSKDNVSKKGVTVPNEDVDRERDNEKPMERSSSTQQEQENQPNNPCPGSTLETSMEYLFYAQSPFLDDNQLRGPADSEQLFIAENGFRGFSGIGTTDFGAAIKLSTSIALLDSSRITSTLVAKGQHMRCNGETQSIQNSATQALDMKKALQLIASGEWELPCGVLLVAKVFPGYTKCISNADVTLAKATSGSAIGKAKDFTGVQSLQVIHGGAAASTGGGDVAIAKQKLYYVFDSALVLPEYFVEYQYVIDNQALGSVRASSATPELRATKSPRIIHCNDEDAVNLGIAAKQVDDFERTYRIRRTQSPQPPENRVYPITDERIARLIQMEPLLPGSIASNDTTTPSISLRLQATASIHIKYLNLLGCELETIPDLSSLNDHLEVLVLSYNKIQGTGNLDGLSRLRTLDLSYNHVVHLGHFENLSSLETLEISHNLIRSFDEVECIGQALAKQALKQLDLRKNGFCDSKRYRFHVLQHLPKLTQLDQQTVSQEEILTAQRLITQLSPAKVWSLHCQKTRCIAPLTSNEVELSDRHPESDDEKSLTVEWSSVEELALNHELLRSIEGLAKAVNLRVASFSDNAIKRIDGLQACTRLEELSLDDNEISEIENLEQLSFLKKLHLGRNHLATIQNLGSLENLIQLSLEENQISSLRGLGSALKLMELYLGNNQIDNLKEIQHLKSLPKLTILDLSGNEITRLPDYRIYSVYYLRRVKVLDGVSVSAQDQSNAKQKYSGKLTFEFILDKCGGGGSATPTGLAGESQFGRIVDMDISSCRIREIGRIPGNVFSNVREINFENNQISDISGLDALPKLRVLNLNRNKIERLTPSSLSSDYTLPDSCDGGGTGILACLNLEQLHLAYNQITDMTALGLQYLDSLKVLHLQGNAIIYFAGLECNTELVDIRLDKNRIRQLDPQSTLALRQLKFLNLEDNGLKSLSNFNNMLSLETLELSNNRLVDLEEVEKLASLPSIIDLRMTNNPLTKKHLYRQHVLFKLNSLNVLDGKDIYSDEKERIGILFLHERAAAAVSGTTAAVMERMIENRAGYQTQLVLTPSSIPTKTSSTVQPLGIPHDEVLTGSLLRKAPPTHGQVPPSIVPAPTFPHSDHEADLSIAIGSSNTTTRSLLGPAHNSYRNLSTLGSQSSWQVGVNLGGSLPSSAAATVASALNANLTKTVGPPGSEQILIGSSLRRRLSSVHYDQQSGEYYRLLVYVNGKFGNGPEGRLPVGLVSSQAVRSPAATIRRGTGLIAWTNKMLENVLAGFNMQPSSTEPQSDHGLPASSIPSVNDRSFSGYVVTFGNQKRYNSNYPGQQETTIPYLSSKLHQARRSSERQQR
ncbi:Leucine-rich repeat-containing protein 9 [Phytophthora citrophthora]|uniref:Leucine-rich repeat-containing protein 9 n=1 Tax=Phytophthora citrophthora TaxID=4793 RepID=A0AAD9LEC1_9STRA|nr:Leucine-rich repeat-containing protein 9 [Phytophthora citrophthora]